MAVISEAAGNPLTLRRTLSRPIGEQEWLW
jgi:hypothetical protein